MSESEVIVSSDRGSRNCGPCTACCDGWMSSETLEMSAGRACKHRVEGGCSIYENRPDDPCKVFRCAWLSSPSDYDESMRPDLIGTIILNDRPWQNWQTLRLVPIGEKVPDRILKHMISFASTQSLPLLWLNWELEGGEYVGYSNHAIGPEDFAAAVRWETDSSDAWTF